MKLPDLFRTIGVISGLAGLVLMILGVIGFLIGDEFLTVQNFYNWFWIANSFLFLGVFLILAYMSCPNKKKEE